MSVDMNYLFYESPEQQNFLLFCIVLIFLITLRGIRYIITHLHLWSQYIQFNNFIKSRTRRESNTYIDNWYKKDFIIQYEPPQTIPTPLLFFLWYNDENNPRVFGALLYYRAAKGWINIEQIDDPNDFSSVKKFHISETSLRAKWATGFDDLILQRFFGEYDQDIDILQLDKNAYQYIQAVTATLNWYCQHSPYMQEEKMDFWVPYYTLTEQGHNIIKHLQWYKAYLEKIDQPIIESELKKNPNFINSILPRLLLFGIRTDLFTQLEETLVSMEFAFENMNPLRTLS